MISAHRGRNPRIDHSAFVAPSAEVIGDVVIDAAASIWHQCVLRGDILAIHIGKRSNIQDMAMIHTSEGAKPCRIGEDVTVGHRAILHGCEIRDRCLVGMGSIVLDGAVLESECMLGAASLVPEGRVLESGYLYFGSPARRIRKLTDEERTYLSTSARSYVALARTYLNPNIS